MFSRQPRVSLCAAWAAIAALAMTSSAQADALSAVQVLREGGCGGLMPAATPLHHNSLLDRAAEQWAGGLAVAAAVQKGGYSADATVGLRVSGPDMAMIGALRRSSCGSIMRHDLQEIGVYRRGTDSWLMLASRYTSPERPQTSELAARALRLINEVRASGTRCGARPFAPVAPVTLSAMLANVAFGHAEDMAEHNYFEHEDSKGRSPAQQVRAAGYLDKLVGENIAYGPKSIDEAVQGWLGSPDHCENIMDPRFAEMGIAYAPGQQERRGLYWVQLLAAPRA